MSEKFDDFNAGKYHKDLMCVLMGFMCRANGVFELFIASDNSADADGAIKLAKTHHPKVNAIHVFAGGVEDIRYLCRDEKWVAYDWRGRKSTAKENHAAA